MGEPPVILGFDTSAAHCAAALLCGEKIVAARRIEMARGQAEELMPLLENLLTEAGLGWRDLDRLGVGIGPGNFTGIRIAVAAARGLALGLGIPAIGVSNFELMAHCEAGAILASLPAPRDTVYLQLLENGQPVGAAHQTSADRPSADFVLPSETRIVGHQADSLGLALGRPFEMRALTEIAPRIARIAAARPGETAARPAPLYVRPADAAPPADPPPVILP